MYMYNDIKSGDLPAPHRPIGYWLKHLDRLIEDTFSRALAGQGLTRRHWQVLNTVARGPASPAELTKALDPFLREDPSAQATTVADLIRRGWVIRERDGRLCLTPYGRTAHQRTQERVQQTRGLILRGVSADEYAAVIDILARMAANLETSAA
jgi:DNA-binding MarR family transcriptional regulator